MAHQDPFAQLESLAASTPLDEYLAQLGERLRADHQFHELFEVRKMQLRHRLGLPLLYDDRAEDLEETTREELEKGLLEACREVGTALFESAKPAEGWLYLRAIGDRREPARLLREIPVTDERLDELIQVAVYEAVDMGYGFELLLEHYGICNAITTFEQIMRERSRDDQQAAAALLVRHLYKELTENVAADRAQREAQSFDDQRLIELITGHEELFEGNAYHVDTSHLAAVVRFARLLDDPTDLRLGWELAEYGRRLAEMYQMPDMPPFEEFYPAHAHYFLAVLNEQEAAVTEALEYFRRHADAAAEEGGPDPSAGREVYLDLLVRLGRGSEAVREAVRLFPSGLPRDLAGILLELAADTGSDTELLEYARRRGDLLTFGTLLALRRGRSA